MADPAHAPPASVEQPGTWTQPTTPPGPGVTISNAILDKYKSDPAFEQPGVPPNFGQQLAPHVMTLQGLVSNISKVYRISDEALKDSFDNARFMEQDVGLWECLEARMRSTALLNWHLEPDDPTSTEQMDLCDELTKILKATPRFMQFRESLMMAIWYGRHACSLRYGWRQFGNRMLIAPMEWRPVHGDKLVFRLDDGRNDVDPKQVGIRVGQTYMGAQKIGGYWDIETTDRGLAYFLSPWERRLLAIHKHFIQDGAYEEPQDAGRIHGVGIRSRVYWEWFQKQETLRWLMEYLERSAFGIELWFYPASNPAAKAQAQKAAKERINNFRNIVFVPVPAEEQGTGQYGVQHVETGLAGVDALTNILTNYFGHRIKRYILGQTLTSESEGGGLGSDGIARVHLATFKDIVRYDSTNLEETITEEYLRPIKEWNFKRAGHFGVRFVIETEEVESDEKLEQYQAAWNMGARISEKKVLDSIGLAVPGDDDRTLMNPQIAQAEQQQAQQQQVHDHQMHVMRAGGTATGKVLNDAMRQQLQREGIQQAGQRSVMGDHFDMQMHKHFIKSRLNDAMGNAA